MKKRIFACILFILVIAVTPAFAQTMTDSCNDFSMVYEKSDCWAIKTNNSDKLGGDTGRFQRSTAATSETAADYQYITYCVEGMEQAEILLYYTSDTALNAFSVSCSADNVAYTPVTCTKTAYTNTSGSWMGKTFQTGLLPYGTTYLRLEVAKAAPATGCGIGQVSITSYEPVTELYCDDLTYPFEDAEKPWRLSQSSITNHADGMLAQTGDSQVICGSLDGARMEFSAIPGAELVVTAYLTQNSIAEEVYAIEFSADRKQWVTAEPDIVPYLIAKNTSTQGYYATVLKAVVPEDCIFARIRWKKGSWQHMLGEVELREAVRTDLFTDELENFKTAVAGSLYMKEEGGHIMKTPYYSADKTFAETARVVEKYGTYSNEQYLVWEVDVTEGRSFAVEATYNQSATITNHPMRLFGAKALDGTWEELETATKITDASISNYIWVLHCAEQIPADVRYVKVQWGDTGNIYDYIHKVTLYEDAPITIDRLKFFRDGELLTQTPAFYLGTTAVTGRIKNPYRAKSIRLRTVAALYDGNGKLIAVNSEPMREGIPAGKEKMFSVAVTDRYGTAKKLRVFFWDGNRPITAEIEDVSYHPEEFDSTSGEMIDVFDDFSKLYDRPQDIRIEANSDTDRFYDFTGKFIRTYPIEQSFKYYVPGAKSMVIDAFLLSKLGDLRIYASCYDGGYQLVPHQRSGLTYTYGGWWYLTYTVAEFPENTEFIKIVIEGNNHAVEYSPCITRVRISY